MCVPPWPTSVHGPGVQALRVVGCTIPAPCTHAQLGARWDLPKQQREAHWDTSEWLRWHHSCHKGKWIEPQIFLLAITGTWTPDSPVATTWDVAKSEWMWSRISILPCVSGRQSILEGGAYWKTRIECHIVRIAWRGTQYNNKPFIVLDRSSL